MPKVKVALIGVGNCASAFIQGIQYYGKLEKPEDCIGLRNPVLAGLSPKDIEVVAAFDVDEPQGWKRSLRSDFCYSQ